MPKRGRKPTGTGRGKPKGKPKMVRTDERVGTFRLSGIVKAINTWLTKGNRPFTITEDDIDVDSHFYVREDISLEAMAGNRFYKVTMQLTPTEDDAHAAALAHLTRMQLLDVVLYIRRFPYKVTDHAGEFLSKEKTNKGGRPKRKKE